MWEVADSVDTELIAVNGLVLYFQSKRKFPSWMSRIRSPVACFQSLDDSLQIAMPIMPYEIDLIRTVPSLLPCN